MILRSRQSTESTPHSGRASAPRRAARVGVAEHPRAPDASLQSALHGETLERLTRLRRILPVLGEELATARREAARLRVENRRLAERISTLEHDLAADATHAARSVVQRA